MLNVDPSESDALSDILRMLRLKGEALCVSELSSPWGIAFPARSANFHVVKRGEGWLWPAGESKPLRLRAGDLALLPHGTAHRVSSAPRGKCVDLARVWRSDTRAWLMRYGGGGALTKSFCGAFAFDDLLTRPMLAGLPKLIVISGAQRTHTWLDTALRFLHAESENPAPGSQFLCARLVEMICALALRHWTQDSENPATGWIGALRDAQISSALAKLHADPKRAWTIPMLAKAVAMSRSAFAGRFTAQVGQSPLQYLTRVRIQRAAQLLDAQRMPLSRIAREVGYMSEAAFSRAFRRHIGMSPLTFRRRQQRGMERRPR